MSTHEHYTIAILHSNNYVMAVIDSPEEAELATGALYAAGFAENAVALSPEAKVCLIPLAESPAMRGSLGQPPTQAQEMLTEEGLDHAEYAAARLQCHVVVRVNTAGNAQVEQARRVLVAHHAHSIKRVGRWTRENLSNLLDG
jgi:hypothetical protein